MTARRRSGWTPAKRRRAALKAARTRRAKQKAKLAAFQARLEAALVDFPKFQWPVMIDGKGHMKVREPRLKLTKRDYEIGQIALKIADAK